MAVEIPVVIDIDKAFEDAAKRVNAAIKPLQDNLSSNALNLRFKIDDKSRMSVKKLLDGSSASAKQLNVALKDVAARISKLQTAGGFVPGNLTSQERDLLNIYTQLRMQISGTNDVVKVFDKNVRSSLNSAARAGKEASDAYANMDVLLGKANSRLLTLVKNSIRLIALHSASNFIRNVREVTSEFEMQRVALAGIIQDTAQAEALFKQIKAAAIKSPFEIKDLVTYTKQLSAYRIETDKLFDVTMQLADVSAGLGVDMNRLVLAYGQVRAASVLRGQELRQFTEAGIPLVELLADKFTELNGRATTTADVFELISKRAVSFSMIEEIFNDMTESGGMFYKMQEKQSETLKGQWMKLRDALSIMYDEIGNTSAVHNAMERLMADAMSLMQNWRYIAGAVKAVGVQFIALKAASLFMPSLARNVSLAKKATDAFSRSMAAAEMAAKTGSASFQRSSEKFLRIATHLEKASLTTNVFKQTWHRMAASMAGGGWIGIVITALTTLIGYLITARQEAERLGKELSGNIAKGNLQIEQAERNFKRLADAAITAADGSSEQREALKELQRTYGDVIPSQDLQIEKLKELKDNYDVLTDAIREKIEMQIHEQNVNEITETYGTSLGTQRKNLEKFLKKEGGYTTEEATRIIAGVNNAIKSGLLTAEKDFFAAADIIEKIIKEQVGVDAKPGIGQAFQQASKFLSGKSYYQKLLIETQKFNTSMEEEEQRFDALNNKMGRYSDLINKIREDLKKAPEGFTLEEAGSFEYNEARWKQAVRRYKEELVKAFEGIDISDAFGADDFIDFKKIFDKLTEDSLQGSDKLKPFVEALQKDYLKLAPQQSTTRLVTEAATRFADAVGISMSRVQGYLKQDETSMEDYAKSVEDFVKSQQERVKELEFTQREFRAGVSNYVRPTDEDIKKEKDELDFLEKLLEFVKEFLKQKSGGSYTEDPWILIYKNRMKFMQDFRKGVEDLDKYMAHSDALAKQREIMEGRGASLGFDVKTLSGSREELLNWYDETIKKITDEISKLGGKTWSGLGVQAILAKDTKSRTLKAWQDLLADVFKERTDFNLSQTKKDLEDAIKKLTDEIRRSEVARDFFKNMLDLTGDEDLSANMTMQVYGNTGDLAKQMQEKLKNAFVLDDNMVEVDDALKRKIAEAISGGDYKMLRQYLQYVVNDNKSAAEDVLDYWEKTDAEYLKNLYKTYQKTKTYDERITDVRKKEAQSRKEIEESSLLSPEQKATFISASEKKEAEEIADIELERLKNTYEWTQAFKDLERVSTETLEELIKLLDEYIEKSGPSATPEALKAATQAREQAQEQLVVRDAYSKAVEGIKRYVAAKKEANKLEKEGKKNTLEYRKAQDKARDALKDTEKAVQEIGNSFNTLSSIVSSVSDVLDLDELSDGKAILSGIASGLSLVGTALVFINAMFTLLESNPVVLAISSIIAGIAALSTVLSNIRVARANREIKKQQELIDGLEKSYDRLEKAMEKAFGSDYIENYNKQIDNLQAKVEAYNKQASLEESKGKKADSDKIREYKDAAEEAEEQIADMRTQLSEYFTESDLTSAAKDFANSWIEAYKEFGSTTDAMREKFQDMIQSMIEQSLGAKIMQTILQPLFDSIDEMAQTGGELTSQEIAQISQMAPEYIDKINNAMTNLMNSLAASGYNVRQGLGQFTGISRDIAGASEESINGLAAGINTQNFYMSLISQNVAAILASMTGQEVNGVAGAATPTDPYKDAVLEHMSLIPLMHEDMYAIRSMLEKVIRPNGTTATHYVATRS